MSTFLQDLRYSGRMLWKNPGFMLVAVVSLAIGIGANTTIFSLVNGILLRPLPGISEPSRLVDVHTTHRYGSFGSMSYPDYEYFRDHNEVFDGVIAFGELQAYINTGGEPEQVLGEIVSGNFFDTLGVRPAQGRFFLPEEDRTPGTHPVAVVSYALWQRNFGSDPNAVGRSLILNGHPYTIIGVAQEGFRGTWVGLMPDIWVPLMMQPQAMPGERLGRGASWLQACARLKDGVSIEQAQAAMTTLAGQLEQSFPETNKDRGIALRAASTVPGHVRASIIGFMGLLMTLVGFVLLIACSNVASMFLARTTGRRKEIAIRLALGATRGHIVRQVLTESVLLFLMGGTVGVLLATWATRLLLAFKPTLDMPVSLDLGIDWRVLGFTLVVSLVTGVIFGLSPALQSSKPDLLPALKSDTPGGGFRRSRTRSAFVVAQIALSLILLIGAGLFLRSLQNASKIDPGFNPDGLQTVGFNLRIQGYDETRGREFYKQLVERVHALPGVEGASLAQMVPLTGNVMSQGFSIEGHEPPAGSDSINVDFNIVDSRYFETLEIPLLRGRSFTEADKKEAPSVAVVNETFARRFFKDSDAVGRRFAEGSRNGKPIEIIGVVKDGKYETLGEDPTPYVYLPYEQRYSPRLTLHVRTSSSNVAGVLAGVRDEVRSLDKDLPLINILPMIDQIGFSLIPLRVAAAIVAVLGVLGLALASVGIFGVVNYSVVQRTREIGIRMALGARGGDVLSMVIKQGLWLALVGVGIGLAGAFALTRALSSLLYGVSASDPVIFIGTALLLAAVAAAASYLPARRATKVDPMIALRYE